MDPIKISFIVPLYNHLAESKEMLSSLLRTMPLNLSYEVILVDDASTDETQQWLETISDLKIKSIVNAVNMGYAKTNNIGVSHASGEILLLINNDLIFSDGWLQPMLDLLENPALKAGVVGNIQRRVVDDDIDHAGVRMTDFGKINHIQQLPSVQRSFYKMFAVTGACMAISKHHFMAVGGLDEAYINGAEDIDFCMKIKAKGKSVYLAANSCIKHHVSLSRDRSNVQNELNSRLFYKTWRDDLKRQLSNQWLCLLQSGVDHYSTFFDGELNDAFVSYPNNASRVIAENFLCREEHRWAQLIDGQINNKNLSGRTEFLNLSYHQHRQNYSISGTATLMVSDLKSAVNFYVCGNKTDPLNKTPIAITISINNIQSKVIVLNNSANINVGIMAPVLLNSISNVFNISVNFVNPDNDELLADASHMIYITHFVIDDQIVIKH